MMIRFWFRLARWFFPRRKWKPVPRQIITSYRIEDADENQRLIMLYGLARSPEEASRLMKQYKVKSAGELIAKIPPRKPPSMKRRLISLIRRIDGHDPRRMLDYEQDPIQVSYRYKRNDEKQN